jgi:hypothetical protein
MASITSAILLWRRRHISALTPRICLRDPPTCLNRDIQHPADLAFSVTPSQLVRVLEY